MVTRTGPLSFHEEIKIKHLVSSGCSLNNNRYPRHVLKSKHTRKPKCKRLYKYKLRPNGEEDPDIIDVSHILLSTLLIKSPTKLLKSPVKYSDLEELRPKNYLSKMARRKQKAQAEATEAVVKSGPNEAKALASPEPETQGKKQTNAFQLLMDSRNKSIGTNSPGKEKCYENDPSERQEIIEKKNLKVKRNLVLQKMAEAKGSLKRKEKEEYEDKFIEKQMEKRAERLKSMIKTQEAKAKKTSKKAEPSKKVVKIEDDSNSEDKVKIINKKPKTLQLVDMFMKPKNKSPEKKVIPKEDEEFLRKLSPPIKKKENMLCYFKKVDKSSTAPEDEDASQDSPVIKVKLSCKNKRKLKKKRLSLNKNSLPEVLKDHNENNPENCDIETQTKISDIPENHEVQEQSHERKKRKRKENKVVEEEAGKAETIHTIETNTDETGRPRRNIKRPVKYSDDVDLSSSDEELHIFSPRKKKRNVDKITPVTKDKIKEIVISDDECKKKVGRKFKKLPEKEDTTQKKPAKLAPIFAPKPQLNPEQLEAKQKFLYSGVPDQLKKIIAQQKILHAEITNEFSVVVHVQQNKAQPDISSELSSLLPSYSSDDNDDTDVKDYHEHLFNKLITAVEPSNANYMPSPKNNATAILQNIKEQYPKFPVHRTFHVLKSKSNGEFKESLATDFNNSLEIIESIVDCVNENPQYLNWTDKYKATSTKHLIGNFESIKELKRWLLSWTETDQKLKNTKTKASDSSDFYDSDSNSRDSFKNNLLVVTGPVGSGKTSSVYAVAAELAIKVIEVNASSKRTGKVMLQELQEATQSHKVNRGGLDNSQKSQEIVDTVTTIIGKKSERSKKFKGLKKSNSKDEGFSQSQPIASQDQVRTGMSLILVDDADIVFEQDDGFSSAITQLTQCSKRPVILVTGSDTCPHLQRFLQYGKVIYMQPLLPKMLGTWLDIMCLAEGSCWQGLGPKILNYFKGDIRKSINCLQFYMTTNSQDCLKGDEALSQNSDTKLSLDEENSNMSWPDSEGNEEKNLVESSTGSSDIVWKQIMHQEINLLHSKYPNDLFNLWWSVPSLLQAESLNVPKRQPKDNMIQDLEAVTNVMDSLSIADYYSHSKPDTSCNLTSEPWFTSESNSVSEQECMDNYNKCNEVTSDILQELVASSIVQAQKTLQCERNTYIQFPSVAAQREKDRLMSRHDSLTSILNPSAALDRKALALDYWSACRTICRVEKNKTDTVSKRNNRFCHHLKSLNVICRNDTFDSLGDSLWFKDTLVYGFNTHEYDLLEEERAVCKPTSSGSKMRPI